MFKNIPNLIFMHITLGVTYLPHPNPWMKCYQTIYDRQNSYSQNKYWTLHSHWLVRLSFNLKLMNSSTSTCMLYTMYCHRTLFAMILFSILFSKIIPVLPDSCHFDMTTKSSAQWFPISTSVPVRPPVSSSQIYEFL